MALILNITTLKTISVNSCYITKARTQIYTYASQSQINPNSVATIYAMQ